MVNEIDFKLPLAHDSYLIRLFFDFQKNQKDVQMNEKIL